MRKKRVCTWNDYYYIHRNTFFFCPVIYIFFPPSLFSKYFRTVSIYTFSTRSRNHRIEGHYFPSKRDSSATIDTSAYFSSFSILAWHDRERMRGKMTALPAFETLLTLRILARRARLTPLYPVENDDITIKLPSAYGNWLNYQISSTNINTSTRNTSCVWLRRFKPVVAGDDDVNLRVQTIGSTFAFIESDYIS